MPKLSIGIVNYNSGHRLRQCIEAIERYPPSCAYEVIVVDNDSKDGSADFLVKEPRERVRLVATGVNLLFTGGVNLAYQRSSGEIFMILNPDLVPVADAFDALLRHFEEDLSLGGIGGYTLDPSGRFERYLGRFPTPFEVLVANYASPRFKRSVLLRRFDYGMKEADFSVPTEVPAPTGGCVAFRRFESGWPMSHEFGIFWSDADLFRRIWATGRRIMVFPDARFVHDHDNVHRQTTTQRGLLLVNDYAVGAVRYFQEHDGAFSAAWMKALLLIGAVASFSFKHVPLWLRGKEPATILRARWRIVLAIGRGDNPLLAGARRRARGLGSLELISLLEGP